MQILVACTNLRFVTPAPSGVNLLRLSYKTEFCTCLQIFLQVQVQLLSLLTNLGGVVRDPFGVPTFRVAKAVANRRFA